VAARRRQVQRGTPLRIKHISVVVGILQTADTP
jgi:hypothetical protein